MVTLVVGCGWLVASGTLPSTGTTGHDNTLTSATGPRTGPPPGRESVGHPLAEPAPLQTVSDSWRALHTGADGEPLRWDPCRPIHYVTRLDGQPTTGAAVVRRAMDRITTATGLQFVDDGSTEESPSDQRAPYQPERYGERWAPVLITWVTAEEVPDMAAARIGQAGPALVETPDGTAAYVSGSIAIDREQVAAAAQSPVGAVVTELVLQHELAHLVGVGHVNDPSQLMHPELVGQRGFGAGDLTGLTALGGGSCLDSV